MVQGVPRGPALLVCLSLGASLGQGPSSPGPTRMVRLPRRLCGAPEGEPGVSTGLLARPPLRAASPRPVRLPVVLPEFAASRSLRMGQRLGRERERPRCWPRPPGLAHPGRGPQARTVLSRCGAFTQGSGPRAVRLLQSPSMARGPEGSQPGAAGTVSASRVLRLWTSCRKPPRETTAIFALSRAQESQCLHAVHGGARGARGPAFSFAPCLLSGLWAVVASLCRAVLTLTASWAGRPVREASPEKPRLLTGPVTAPRRGGGSGCPPASPPCPLTSQCQARGWMPGGVPASWFGVPGRAQDEEEYWGSGESPQPW